ncbi:efflux transporter outer membrane subunit [Herbaspirillum sp. AP02]|uniref:efflux transporter outer membrane subunit n=1 Tax=unclassified Herbaspirillum TaxID=2624150 RepID=UPI0015DB72A5|nr:MULTISPECIES: efflux transporter outer membrane subunit [unclassified Herbaspirillum]MBG7620404.1 efflux transporter outer membrane subunit [Herbaspirillum sp. AP02]NZD67868.1 efflux transporter outer membrane subunit [Herbaspirillum sp. AP21]
MSAVRFSNVPRPLALAAALLVSGCALGPTGEAPASPQPAHYAVDATPTTLGPQEARQKFVLGQRAVPHWWRAYGSPELSAWVDEALRSNHSLAQADRNLAAARLQLRAQIDESLWPTIDAVGQAQRQRALGLPNLGPTTNLYNVFAGQIRASYTFDLFGVERFANSAAAAQVDAQSYQFDAARRSVAANVVITAINAASLHAQVMHTERLVALADADVEEMQRRLALGAVSQDELLSAQASAQSLRASLPGMKAQWQASRHALAVLMGRTPDAAPADLDITRLQLPGEVPLALPSELLRQRPDILAADAALKVAAAEQALATAEMFPSLSISASFGQSGFSWAKATSGAGAVWGLGASLTQPLFHGGALSARRDASKEAYLAAEANYRQTVLNAFQNVADSLVALTQDADALQASTAARAASEQGWRNAQRRAQLGAYPASATRAGERQYLNARLGEVRATASRMSDTATLFQAMGVGIEVPAQQAAAKP